jgi:hypothetical protein
MIFSFAAFYVVVKWAPQRVFIIPCVMGHPVGSCEILTFCTTAKRSALESNVEGELLWKYISMMMIRFFYCQQTWNSSLSYDKHQVYLNSSWMSIAGISFCENCWWPTIRRTPHAKNTFSIQAIVKTTEHLPPYIRLQWGLWHYLYCQNLLCHYWEEMRWHASGFSLTIKRIFWCQTTVEVAFVMMMPHVPSSSSHLPQVVVFIYSGKQLAYGLSKICFEITRQVTKTRAVNRELKTL